MSISDDPIMEKHFKFAKAGQVFLVRALTRKVLAVAVKGDIGDWAAYIDAVPGNCHEEEKREVANTGVKLDSRLAAVLFPSLDIKKYRL